MNNSSPPPTRPDWLAALLLQRNNDLMDRAAVGLARLAALPRGLRARLRRTLPSLASVGLLLALGAGSFAVRPAVFAAGITVDGVTCTLVDAVRSANSDAAFGGCAAGSGDDLITLTADVVLTQAFGNVLDEPSGLPLISTTMTIEGNGHTISRDPAADPFHIFSIQRGTLTLNDLTVSGGDGTYGGAILAKRSTITISSSTISGNDAAISGGAIHQYRGRLYVSDSTLSGNDAGNGGAIYAYTAGLTFSDTTISNNSADYGAGGGAYLTYSEATLSNVTLTGNGAAVGGALNVTNTNIDIIDSMISGNTADAGGGLYSYAGSMSIATSTLSNNDALYNGGAIYSYATPLVISRSTVSGNSAVYGGGIYNAGLVFEGLMLANSTVSGNSAVYGSGLSNSGTAELLNSTLTGNTAEETGGGIFNFDGLLTLERSLISGNTAATAGTEVARDGGTVNSNGGNVFSHAGQATADALTTLTLDGTDFDASSDAGAVALSAILDTTLTNNGGPTLTHALPVGSPALDRGSSGACAAPPIDNIDQRGQSREIDGDGVPTGDECDSGAFEFNPDPATATPTATATMVATTTPTSTATLDGTTTPTATATATPDLTASPTPSPTATATGETTATPSPTPTATSTIDPTATSTPVAENITLYLPMIVR